MKKELMKKETFVMALPDFTDKDYAAYIERERVDIAFEGIQLWREANPDLNVTEMTIGEAKTLSVQMNKENDDCRVHIKQRDIFKQISVMTESRNIQKTFYSGDGFVSCPGDVMTIEHTPHMISDSISIHITNEGTVSAASIITDEYLGLKNCLEAWKWLKSCDDISSREVMLQRDDDDPIKFKDSKPYKCRFEN